MSDSAKPVSVSMVGLGNLGFAMAKQFLEKKNFTVTVWNRTPAKADPLKEAGAKVASTVGEAITASDVVMICVLNYGASDELFKPEEVSKLLKGKTVIQVTTGSPQDGREGAKWFGEQGAKYVDGCILDEPSGVGKETFTHAYSGHKAAFEACKPLLLELGPNLLFIGEDAGLAAAFDFGVLSFLFSVELGYVHGAAICQKEGVPLEIFNGTAQAVLTSPISPMMAEMGKMMVNRSYPGHMAKLSTYTNATQRIVKYCEQVSLDKTLPAAIDDCVGRAVADGHGEEDFSAIFETFLKK